MSGDVLNVWRRIGFTVAFAQKLSETYRSLARPGRRYSVTTLKEFPKVSESAEIPPVLT